MVLAPDNTGSGQGISLQSVELGEPIRRRVDFKRGVAISFYLVVRPREKNFLKGMKRRHVSIGAYAPTGVGDATGPRSSPLA